MGPAQCQGRNSLVRMRSASSATGGAFVVASRDDSLRSRSLGQAPGRAAGQSCEDDDGVVMLSATTRRHEHDMSEVEVRQLLADAPGALHEVLPTFAAAIAMASGGTRVATDYLGFRHVFLGRKPDDGVVSTSSRACATALGAELDHAAIAVQSCLGWQLGDRTLFEGVAKLPPATIATLEAGAVALSSYARPRMTDPPSLGRAVTTAADFLRTYLQTYVEQHPDAGLQLTGGQDSRLLLSAIPGPLRKRLRAVTLGAPGDEDLTIASELAARFGMRHEVLTLSGLEALDPDEAFSMCLEAAHRLDYSADPIAHAALTYAESRSEPGPRISGLGGEVARGFYYLGPPTRARVSQARARRLAAWRMFANEAVPAEALQPAFRDWAREFATREVIRALTESRRPWMEATDDLYLNHRMQRWGGVTETAVCLDREIVNPMLDDRFISLAQALAPRDKRNSRFLSMLQLELDEELGGTPLDGRPPPAAYAGRSWQNSARLARATMSKSGSKVVQRLRARTRTPAGGEVLVQKVASHLRADPSSLSRVDRLDVFAPAWLGALAAGDIAPSSSALALVLNLIAASTGVSEA